MADTAHAAGSCSQLVQPQLPTRSTGSSSTGCLLLPAVLIACQFHCHHRDSCHFFCGFRQFREAKGFGNICYKYLGSVLHGHRKMNHTKEEFTGSSQHLGLHFISALTLQRDAHNSTHARLKNHSSPICWASRSGSSWPRLCHSPVWLKPTASNPGAGTDTGARLTSQQAEWSCAGPAPCSELPLLPADSTWLTALKQHSKRISFPLLT